MSSLSDDKKAFHCIALSKKLEVFTLGQLVLPGRLPFLKPKVNWLLHLLRKRDKKTNRKQNKMMKAELILPIECLKGMLRKDGYYFRMYKGKQIVQRCPTKWKDTPARKAAREKFAKTWGQRYKKH